MHIIVLIKAIPDLSGIYVSKSQQKVVENNPPVISCASENALEYALSIKDKAKAFVIVIMLVTKESPYPTSPYEGILRIALSMGADKAYLLSDPVFLDGDPYSNTYVLGEAIKKLDSPCDLLVAGKGETGIRVAEYLGLSEGVFISMAENANTPRIPSALNIIKAAKQDIVRWDAGCIGVKRELCGKDGRLTEVVRTYLIQTQ